jgi:23S rRNA (cytosine1962-C5)-methyltransferase
MGLFPEQAPNWDWIRHKLSFRSGTEVLNLFAYTGGATLAAAASGAAVCHVDSSRSAILAAKENLALSGLPGSPVRLIAEDVSKFVAREIRRGRRYGAVVMDPPSFGRGPKGQTWEIARDLEPLLEGCAGLLDRKPLFVMVSFHTTGLSACTIEQMLDRHIGRIAGGRVHSRRMSLTSLSGKTLPCGVTVTWEAS